MKDIRYLVASEAPLTFTCKGRLYPLCEGVEGLLQVVVRNLLTLDNGIFGGVNVGTSLKYLIRRYRISGDVLALEIRRRIANLERQMRSEQDGLNLPASERIRSLGVERIDYDGEENAVEVTLTMALEDGTILTTLINAN